MNFAGEPRIRAWTRRTPETDVWPSGSFLLGANGAPGLNSLTRICPVPCGRSIASAELVRHGWTIEDGHLLIQSGGGPPAVRATGPFAANTSPLGPCPQSN